MDLEEHMITVRRSDITALACFVVATLAACQSAPEKVDPDLVIDKVNHPEERYFEGQIISLRPTVNTMLISRGSSADQLNIVTCVYNPATKIFVDGKPAGLGDLGRGMPVKVKGHMEGVDTADERCVVDVAKFTTAAAQK
jgi:hypothetical protein